MQGMPPRHRFLVDVDTAVPLYIMSPLPYTQLENTYMRPSAFTRCIPGPKELLPHHFYYPASGLFLIENRLITAGGTAWARRFWFDAFKSAETVLSLHAKFVDGRVLIKMTHVAKGAQPGHQIPCTWESTASLFHNGVLLVILVRRIQRAVLRYLHRLAEPKRLALAMGLDAKLGGLSYISMLPSDLLGSAVVPLLNRVV
jgi:hypothetical protein